MKSCQKRLLHLALRCKSSSSSTDTLHQFLSQTHPPQHVAQSAGYTSIYIMSWSVLTKAILFEVITLTYKQFTDFPTARIISWAPFFIEVSFLLAQDLSKRRIHNPSCRSTSVDYSTSMDPQPQSCVQTVIQHSNAISLFKLI